MRWSFRLIRGIERDGSSVGAESQPQYHRFQCSPLRSPRGARERRTWRTCVTHNRPADETYVKIAVGRDYADVPPTRGHYKGVTQRTMDVDVSVEQIADDE